MAGEGEKVQGRLAIQGMFLVDLSADNLKLPLPINGLQLRVASSVQVVQMFHDSYDEWGVNYGPRDAYLKANVRMHTGDFGSHCCSAYILVNEQAEQDTCDFYAHCWVYRREALWVPSMEHARTEHGQQEADMQVLPIWSVSIVFVPLRYRGRGYGKTLMRHLQALLVINKIQLSTLYSDIEDGFYAKVNYHAMPKHEWTFPLADCGPSVSLNDHKHATLTKLAGLKSTIEGLKDVQIRPIYFSNAGALIEKERRVVYEQCSRLHAGPRPFLSIMPIAGNVEWDWTDMTLEYASLKNSTFEDAKDEIISGIEFNSAETDDEGYLSYVLWSSDFVTRELVVTRVSVNRPDCFRFILEATKIVAASYRHESVLLWGPRYASDYFSDREDPCRPPMTDMLKEHGFSLNPDRERIPCLAVQEIDAKEPSSAFWTPAKLESVNWAHNEAFFWV